MMSLRARLIFSYLGVLAAGMVLLLLLTGRATADAFGRYLGHQEGEALVPLLQAHYVRSGSWEAVGQAIPAGWIGQGMAARGHGPGPGSGLGVPSPVAVVDSEGKVVWAGAGLLPGQTVSAAALAAGLPVEVDGSAVGWVVTGQIGTSVLPAAARSFLLSVNRAMLLAAMGAAAAAIVIGVVIAGGLTGSLRQLTLATEAVAAGDLGRQVEVGGGHEIKQLAASFNQMSLDLARAAEVRRQLTADIAHELRTPLSLILGHAEGLLEGVLPVDSENLQVMHDEARRLDRIVDDLRVLSLADSGELDLIPEPTDPSAIGRDVVASRRASAARRQVELELQAQPNLPAVNVDPDRMNQVLGNLIDNALRHAPAGGTTVLRIATEANAVRFTVEDDGAGIPEAELERIFSRFYRVDASRSRAEGGSGLGLAIARSLVNAHGGRIWAENRAEGGARMVVELPAAERQE